MRILKDILTGIVAGLIIVLLTAKLIPGAGEIWQGYFQNAEAEIRQLIEGKTNGTAGPDFTKLYADGKKISDQSFQARDSGITGDDITFDASVNPYYEMLNDSQKTLYAQMYANAESASASFVPEVSVSADDVKTVFEAVFYDHPELFWLDTGYSYQYTDDGNIVEIDLKYNETASDLDHARTAFSQAADAVIQGARQYADPLSQERYVHNAIIDSTDYDLNASMNQSAYSALVNHATVCAGYSKAFQYIMNQLGIPTYYVTGISENEDHAWNIVAINGRYVNVDLTWDDTSGSRYRYFNLSDAEMQDSHTRTGLSVNLAACN